MSNVCVQTCYGEGDTNLLLDIVPPRLAQDIFYRLREEVQWHTMFHRGGEVPRLVSVQTKTDDDGSYPIYRHPSDSSPLSHPFSPTVELIQKHIQPHLSHVINHVLIQYYRHGSDYISEHSDKTIDIVRGSSIVNVSFGAERVMTLRQKKDPQLQGVEKERESQITSAIRRTERIPLPHNSMLVMGLETNSKWLHSIRTDNRPSKIKSDSELAYDGERISLTFRHIATYLTKEGTHIFGQGAKGKTKLDMRAVVVGGHEAEQLLMAFGKENHLKNFDWNDVYGKGFDVLHFTDKGPEIKISHSDPSEET